MLTNRRGWWYILSFLGAAAALWWSACGLPESSTDACTDTVDDCNGMPGTTCHNKRCTCLGGDLQWCRGECRHAAECLPELDAGSDGSGTGGDGAGGTPGTECHADDDCNQPDARCGTASCANGFCIKQITVGPIDSQIKGDCTVAECDSTGAVVMKFDSNDVYNDGNQCTYDDCQVDLMGKSIVVNLAYPKGAVCPETNEGFCFEGNCVQCIGGFTQCNAGLVCAYTTCVPAHCQNLVFDKALGETDFDCGGPCQPCQAGEQCKIGSDCIGGVCFGSSCQPPSCPDGVTNDGETDIDCGGPPSCPRCGPDKACDLGSDCESHVCWAGKCEAPTCNDGLLNGEEKGVDCGGSCATQCN